MAKKKSEKRKRLLEVKIKEAEKMCKHSLEDKEKHRLNILKDGYENELKELNGELLDMSEGDT